MSKQQNLRKSTPLRIVFIYILVGALWIIFSDQALLYLIPDGLKALDQVQTFQTIKGWLYVLVTAALLYTLINNSLQTIWESTETLRQNEIVLRMQARELTALHEAALAIASTLTVDEALQTLAERMGWIVDATDVGIYGWNSETNTQQLLGHWTNIPDHTLSTLPTPAPDLCWQVLQEKQPRVFQVAVANHPTNSTASSILASSLLIPLVIYDNAIGYVQILRCQPGSVVEFSEAEIRLCQSLAADAAITLEHAHLFQAEREQRETAEALAEAAQIVNSAVGKDRILDRILEQAARVVSGDALQILQVEDDATVCSVRSRVYAPIGPEAEKQLQEFNVPIPRYKEIEALIREGTPLIITDTWRDPVQPLEWRWARSWMGVPICSSEGIIGLLFVLGTHPEQFTPRDIHRLEAFADHVATALHNAQHFEDLQRYTEHLEQRVQERTAQIETQYAQLQAILNSTSDGILVVTRDGTIIQANPVAQNWLTQSLPPHDQQALLAAVQALARMSPERAQQELSLSGMDIELHAAPIPNDGLTQSDTSVIAIHDISHLKTLNRMKLEFISNVSHELRTPITAIKLYISLLQQSPPEKWEKYLLALSQEAERQSQLVEAILQISRIDAGRLELRPLATPLNDFAENIIVAHDALAEHHRQQLRFFPHPNDPIVMVDPEQFQLAISNLLSNALRYTPEGGQITVTIGLEELEGRNWVALTVKDNGIGIPEAELPYIFERFYRGETPRSLQIRGTGLGLAIVKEIVHLHGGRIEVQSQLGQGSTFTLWLPVVQTQSKSGTP